MTRDQMARIAGISAAVWMVITALAGANLGTILAPIWLTLLGYTFYLSILFILDGLATELEPDDPDKTVRIAPPPWAPTDPEPPTVPLAYNDGSSQARQPSH